VDHIRPQLEVGTSWREVVKRKNGEGREKLERLFGGLLVTAMLGVIHR